MTHPPEETHEALASAIDRVVGKWLNTHFALAQASFALPRPDQVSIEWVGHQALDQAQHLHLSGYQHQLTPKILDLFSSSAPEDATTNMTDDDCASIGDLGYWRDRALQAEAHIADHDQLADEVERLREYRDIPEAGR